MSSASRCWAIVFSSLAKSWFICRVLLFTSRTRHARCALVTGVQTCALPILLVNAFQLRLKGIDEHAIARAAEPLQRICADRDVAFKIGRASCRARGCQYV